MVWLGVTISVIIHCVLLLLVNINKKDTRSTMNITKGNIKQQIAVTLTQKKMMPKLQRTKPQKAKVHQAEKSFSYSHSKENKKEGKGKKKELTKETIKKLKKEGLIPELVIDFPSWDEYLRIAQTLEYQLVAYDMNKRKYLCRVDLNNWRLQTISSSFLQGYSKRARQLVGEELHKTREKIVSRYVTSPEFVHFYFLIPIEIEDRFIQVQMNAINSKGVNPEEVKSVLGKYTTAPSIKIEKLKLKNGETIEL